MRTSGPEARAALAKHPELGTNLWRPVRIRLLQRYERFRSVGYVAISYQPGVELRVTAAEAALLIEDARAVLLT